MRGRGGEGGGVGGERCCGAGLQSGDSRRATISGQSGRNTIYFIVVSCSCVRNSEINIAILLYTGALFRSLECFNALL